MNKQPLCIRLGPDPTGLGALHEEEIGIQTHTEGWPREDSEETAVHAPRREVSGGTSPARTWGSQPPASRTAGG